MKKIMVGVAAGFLFGINAFGAVVSTKDELQQMYQYHCANPSDINEHVPVLKDLAQECSSVMEIGIRSMVSSWGIFQGLSESSAKKRNYIGIDLNYPPLDTLCKAASLAQSNGIFFQFLAVNDMQLAEENIASVDMLFIDSLHTYCHLTYELEKFSPKVGKYIAMHDTSAPWGNVEDTEYQGDYSEYPAHYDRTKKGLWPAVENFLKNHPEWELKERRFNNHGLTVLKRK